MSEQLDLFDASNGGDQSRGCATKSTSVRQFAVTRQKLASEQGVCEFASSPSTYIWRTGDGEHTPQPSAAQFAAASTTPKRIRRERRHGWRKPGGAVIVDRTTSTTIDVSEPLVGGDPQSTRACPCGWCKCGA